MLWWQGFKEGTYVRITSSAGPRRGEEGARPPKEEKENLLVGERDDWGRLSQPTVGHSVYGPPARMSHVQQPKRDR